MITRELARSFSRRTSWDDDVTEGGCLMHSLSDARHTRGLSTAERRESFLVTNLCVAGTIALWHIDLDHGAHMTKLETLCGLVLLPAVAMAQAALSVRAENPLQIARASETIAVPWASVRSGLAGVSPTDVRVIDLGSGDEIVSQVVDNDGDGTMDELIFQVDLAPGETRRFT